MLSFFRLNDPSRILFLLVLAFLLRLPFLFFELPLSPDHYSWAAIGERYHQGFFLYSEIWTNAGPVYVWFLSLGSILFGNSIAGQILVGTLLIWISAWVFNQLVNDLEALKSKSFVPGAVFVFLSAVSFEFFVFSPQLLSLPFLLLSLRYILLLFRKDPEEDHLFFSAVFFGLSTAIHPPLLFLAPFFFLFLVFGISGKMRHSLWWLAVLLFFWVVLFFNFWMKSQQFDFLDSISFELFKLSGESLWEYRVYFAIFSPVLFLIVVSVLSLIFRTRFLSYHIRIQRTFYTLGALSLGVVLFSGKLSFYTFLPLIIPLSFFLSQYYFETSRGSVSEFVISSVFILSVVLNLSLITKSNLFSNLPLVSDRLEKSDGVLRRNVMVFGSSGRWSKNNSISGPLVNWPLAEHRIKRFGEQKIELSLVAAIEIEKPEIIIDEVGYFQELRSKNLSLSQTYSQWKEGYYFRDR